MHINNIRDRLLNCKSGPHQRSFFAGNLATMNWSEEEKRDEQLKQQHVVRGVGVVGTTAKGVAVVLTDEFSDVMFLANAHSDITELFSRLDSIKSNLENLYKLAEVVQSNPEQKDAFIKYVQSSAQEALSKLNY